MRNPLRGLERALPIALLRAREATMRKFKPHVDSLNLSMPQWRVIRALAENDTLAATKLAERCVVLPSSITRILNSLTEMGYIQETVHPDGRRRLVSLTAAGRLIYRQMAVKSEAIYRVIEERLSQEKMQVLLELLAELTRVADEIPASMLPPVDASFVDKVRSKSAKVRTESRATAD